jgi:hypothetical protein
MIARRSYLTLSSSPSLVSSVYEPQVTAVETALTRAVAHSPLVSVVSLLIGYATAFP